MTSRPLRWRVMTSESAASACSTSPDSSAGETEAASTSHVQDVTSSCREPARSSITETAWTSIPAGRASDNRAGKLLMSTSPAFSAASSRSRYSATDSWPVGRASPKLTLGRGENPWV